MISGRIRRTPGEKFDDVAHLDEFIDGRGAWHPRVLQGVASVPRLVAESGRLGRANDCRIGARITRVDQRHRRARVHVLNRETRTRQDVANGIDCRPHVWRGNREGLLNTLLLKVEQDGTVCRDRKPVPAGLVNHGREPARWAAGDEGDEDPRIAGRVDGGEGARGDIRIRGQQGAVEVSRDHSYTCGHGLHLRWLVRACSQYSRTNGSGVGRFPGWAGTVAGAP